VGETMMITPKIFDNGNPTSLGLQEITDGFTHWSNSYSGQRYYYLVVDGPSAAVSSDDIQSFFRTGIDADELFAFVDISSDKRLETALKAIKDGPDLWDKIKSETPVFLSSAGRIPDAVSAQAIHVRPIKNYRKDAADFLLLAVSSVDQPKILEVLKRFNKIANLRPSLFGVGLNINAIIDEMIAGIERTRSAK
jgi:hypothetical protein